VETIIGHERTTLQAGTICSVLHKYGGIVKRSTVLLNTAAIWAKLWTPETELLEDKVAQKLFPLRDCGNA
jgi:hypothetical protein